MTTTLQSDIASVNFRTYTLDLSALPPNAIGRLIQYGFSQMLQDAVSGLKAKAQAAFEARNADGDAGEPFTQMLDYADIDYDAALAMTEDAFVNAVLSSVFERKIAAISAGEFSIRAPGAPQRTPLEIETDAVASEIIRRALKNAGRKAPKGAEFKALITKALESASGDMIRKEAKKRLDAAAKAPALDLTGLGL